VLTDCIELSPDRQRIDGAFNATDALVIIISHKKSELDITLLSIASTRIFKVAINNKLGAISIEPLAQVITLCENQSILINGLISCSVKQSDSIFGKSSITSFKPIIRTTCTPRSGAQLQSFYDFFTTFNAHENHSFLNRFYRHLVESSITTSR
jgi:hypothetical protein